MNLDNREDVTRANEENYRNSANDLQLLRNMEMTIHTQLGETLASHVH